MNNRQLEITKRYDGYGIGFFAMASPCEVLIDSDDPELATQVGQLVAAEVWRIEDKYSRYRPSSHCSQINASNGSSVAIDHETYLLLNFANQCYELSGGLFDITSGVLRKVWQFDGGSNIPTADAVNGIIANLGWRKLSYDRGSVVVPPGMEVDFGGIGKEYAVDRAIMLVKQLTDVAVLVNLGGDLCVTGTRANKQPWQVGVEHPGFEAGKTMAVSLYRGALATSGDAKRFLVRDNKRYSHILNPKTGWPIIDAPRSMTVAAPTCVQAGMLATLSMLQGSDAENFLDQQIVKYWTIR